MSATAAPPAARATGARGCSVAVPARRLADTAFVGVPALLAAPATGAQAWLGFAEAKDRAAGLAVDLTTLRAARTFTQAASGGNVLGVVPLVRRGKPTFAMDRSDPALAFARTVEASPPFTIGVASEGFARRLGGTLEVLWPGKSEDPTITVPRVASVAGTGHAVVFRHGGQEGKVLSAWLGPDGSKQSGLTAVPTTAALVGTPTIAVAAGGDTTAPTLGAALIAFAAKASASDPWHVELARAAALASPEAARAFAVPAGGPGGEAISPAADALPDGGFLIQWTEGSAGNRVVRAQSLAPDLVPRGEPATLSTPDQNAGQGAVWVRGSEALVVYFVKRESSQELWGASLKCP